MSIIQEAYNELVDLKNENYKLKLELTIEKKINKIKLDDRNEQIEELKKIISEITADMSNVDDIERTSENE